MSPTRVLLAGAPLLAALCLSAPAHGAPPLREHTYKVSVEVAYDERWSATQFSDRECDDGRCVRDEQGTGLTKIRLRTPSPQRVSVTSGGTIKQPMIVHSIDAGIPLKGLHLVSGTHTVDYRGPWEGANPDEAAATSGCGRRDVKTDIAFGWNGRHRLQPVMTFDHLREDCPNTIPLNADWEGAGQPELMSTLGSLAESKLRRATDQFTVRANSKSRGLVPAINRTEPDDIFRQFGQIESRWHWEATFRKVGKRKRQR